METINDFKFPGLPKIVFGAGKFSGLPEIIPRMAVMRSFLLAVNRS
jgi:hypothetical protein